ncbi:ATPase [Enterococcus moraviensis ATCC BAA-383]|uniref:ATPase n=1 Tax=Enterococcus moraviensis ATCC BAA-383 TaxID=1158609 RepID=R2RDE1_9ENTE|nr:MoxR family ATPase [Enterococcus moraviensis]EOI07015.1 ATPase [Enterococcus moraviensis ATCC BAA-383]EOT65357.1 ATPase [Enterococcus moraviensis ATCC BAA-383]OJG66756.1 ATPase [Enterococcus moraviensis]
MLESAHQKITLLIDEMEKVILGKRDVLQLTVTAFLAGGHVLFEDIPGVGKTMMVKTLAKATHGTFNRIQFTPDLLPSDILGVSIYNTTSQSFEFHQGPIFTTVLLADEINRTTPRTQAALLEAMSENHVTIDNQTYPLNQHFFVLATQNPLDYEGTYPLPEAQLDRFLFKLHVGYPEFSDELNLILNQTGNELNQIRQILSSSDISQLKRIVDDVYVDAAVARYALQLVHATRNHDRIALGISPRGSISFIRAAKAFALTEGRNYVTPSDLQLILPATFGHRLLLKGGHPTSTENVQVILDQLLTRVPVPVRK